jgi:3-hydroxyacyl-CoA dehydrogenase
VHASEHAYHLDVPRSTSIRRSWANLAHQLGDPKCRTCPLLRRMVAVGHLGRKSGRGFYEYP